MSPQPAMNGNRLPVRPVERWLTPVKRFMHIESSSGMILIGCTILALVLANSPAAYWFASLWKTKVELKLGEFVLAGDIGHLIINDGLMAIFFFVIGLEIKREIVAGELSDPKKALLPVFAALGGMVMPALIYVSLQWGQPGLRGWAIPMATDIAFVVGILALFGNRIPFGLKILLLSLAIVDDLGAVLVIALVYTGSIAWNWLLVAVAGFAVTYAMNRAGVRSVGVYVMVGMVIWLAVFKSGVHPTIAGVMLGLMTPSSAYVGRQTFLEVFGNLWERIQGQQPDPQENYADLAQLQFAAREAMSPLHRLEHALHPWVGFAIMPLFALANAGVPLDVSGLRDPVALAVAIGLAVGKPVGILFFSWVPIRLGLCALPEGVSWKIFLGGACLAGIGFTMALFINGLAFPVAEFPTKEASGKIGTLAGSLVSATIGIVLLLLAVRRSHPAEPTTTREVGAAVAH